MSVVSTLVGGGVFDVLSKAIDRIWPDATERDKMKLELFRLQQEGALRELEVNLQMSQGQTAVNQVEATNSNIFVSGWRPFIGWICGFAFMYQFLLRPLITVILSTKGIHEQAPALELGDLITILGGMLGLGTMRSVEKVVGIKK